MFFAFLMLNFTWSYLWVNFSISYLVNWNSSFVSLLRFKCEPLYGIGFGLGDDRRWSCFIDFGIIDLLWLCFKTGNLLPWNVFPNVFLSYSCFLTKVQFSTCIDWYHLWPLLCDFRLVWFRYPKSVESLSSSLIGLWFAFVLKSNDDLLNIFNLFEFCFAIIRFNFWLNLIFILLFSFGGSWLDMKSIDLLNLENLLGPNAAE